MLAGLEGAEENGSFPEPSGLVLEVEGDREQVLLRGDAQLPGSLDDFDGGQVRGRGRRRARGELRARPRRREWWLQLRMAEAPTLAEARAHGHGGADVVLGLDALGDDRGARALGWALTALTIAAIQSAGHLCTRFRSELEDVRAQEGHQRERVPRGADVVEGDAPAQLANHSMSAIASAGWATSARSVTSTTTESSP